MAKYLVKEGMQGYINDRMEKEGAVFEADEGIKGSWFDAVADAPVAEVVADSVVEAQAAANESAVAESGDGTHTAETAAAEDADTDDGVEVL